MAGVSHAKPRQIFTPNQTIMIYRITGAIFFIATAIELLGLAAIPSAILGIIGLIAGIALAAGQ